MGRILEGRKWGVEGLRQSNPFVAQVDLDCWGCVALGAEEATIAVRMAGSTDVGAGSFGGRPVLAGTEMGPGGLRRTKPFVVQVVLDCFGYGEDEGGGYLRARWWLQRRALRAQKPASQRGGAVDGGVFIAAHWWFRFEGSRQGCRKASRAAG